MRKLLTPLGLALALVILGGGVLAISLRSASASAGQNGRSEPEDVYPLPRISDNGFQVEVLVNGQPLPEYASRGRRYIEALENAEYVLRIHNPLSTRVAVALSVDGLNTIDARHTSAWDAHKWVIEPYGTIEIGGWQMSSSRARRFYFTSERDSYGAKLGQTENLGVISAVFFRERASVVATPITPRPRYEDKGSVRNSESPSAGDSSAANESSRSSAAKTRSEGYPSADDESAATGIGRSVSNDVRWIRMDLDSRPASEVMIRYEYRAGLVKLGIIPRDYQKTEVLDRRERARGFEPKYCPDPE